MANCVCVFFHFGFMKQEQLIIMFGSSVSLHLYRSEVISRENSYGNSIVPVLLDLIYFRADDFFSGKIDPDIYMSDIYQIYIE